MKRAIDIVSASAGSGKTTRLAGELERAVIELGVSPERIVATTFTKKAAAELIERGRQALLRAGRAEDAELFRAARIGTVNAVAGMLVSEFAFEAGVSPGLLVLDEDRADEAFRRSLSEVVTHDDLQDLARLAGRFAELPWQNVVQRIANAARSNHISVEELANNCDASIAGFSKLLGPQAPATTNLDNELLDALELARTALRDATAEGSDKTKKSADALEHYERAIHRFRGQRNLPWPDWARLCSTSAGAKSDACCEAVRAIASRFLEHPSFHEDCELAMRLCFGLAGRALSAYRRYKVERHAIDFVDQETLALELLERDDVRHVLAEDIALVLVDEFQDVSPLQLALFLALSRIAPRSIWVGDQKQAIYGFRGADPALMESVVAEVLGSDEPETLGVGRRSRAPLVHLTNALFVGPFGAAGLPASRVKLVPSSEDDDPILGPYVERWRLDARNADQAIQRLAQQVRALVDDSSVHVRDRGDGAPRRMRPGDIAILCRRRDTCLALADRLADLDVVADVARSGLLGTPEGRAVSAGLRLWADPSDRLAQAELVQLLSPSPSAIDALLTPATPDPSTLPDPITRLLARRQADPFAGAVDAFDSVVNGLELDDVVTRWGRARTGLANLDALRAHAVSFMRLARHHGGASSPAALVSHLQSLASDADDKQASIGGEDVVQVMTWHAAKGLEWSVVVLFELDNDFPTNALGVHVDDVRAPSARLERPLEGRTIRYWPEPFHSRTSRTPFHDALRAHEIHAQIAEREEREEVRLLYVGWTRARDRIILASRTELSAGALGLFALGGGSAPQEPTSPIAGSPNVLSTVTWSGQQVDVLVRSCPDAPLSVSPTVTLPEVLVRGAAPAYPPAWLRPSDAEVTGSVDHLHRLGPPLAVTTGFEPLALGSAVHAFFAADRADLDVDDRSEMGARLLSGWGVAGALSLEALLAMGDRLKEWIDSAWKGARVRCEWPIEHRLPTGTVVRGQADLVLERGPNAAVVDHKIIASDEAEALEAAASYAGQLGVYADAIEAAQPGRRVETWVHLPLSGLVVRVFRG